MPMTVECLHSDSNAAQRRGGRPGGGRRKPAVRLQPRPPDVRQHARAAPGPPRTRGLREDRHPAWSSKFIGTCHPMGNAKPAFYKGAGFLAARCPTLETKLLTTPMRKLDIIGMPSRQTLQLELSFCNRGSGAFELKPMERLAQLVLVPVVQARFEEMESFDSFEPRRSGIREYRTMTGACSAGGSRPRIAMAEERFATSKAWLASIFQEMFRLMHNQEHDNFDNFRYPEEHRSSFFYDVHARYLSFLVENADALSCREGTIRRSGVTRSVR